MKVPYAGPCYGQPEIDAVVRVLADPGQIVAGPQVERFEREIAALFAKPHGVMVNSGSSANLLALAALDLPADEVMTRKVITPALTFATTVAPILQLGLWPEFVDVGLATYVVDANDVLDRVDWLTAAIMVPLLLGNVPDMAALSRSGRPLIEDSCDTLGAEWLGKPTGSYADVSTTSFYASHIITAAGGGGMACFREEQHATRARLLAYWGRASTLYGHGAASEDMAKRYALDLDGVGPYDGKFTFLEAGYNLQPLELQAAFASAQLERLSEFACVRAAHFRTLFECFAAHEDVFVLPEVLDGAKPNWLAFPVQVRPDAPFTRQELATHLEAAGVQTRPIMTGNILRQPGFAHLGSGRYPNADQIMRSGLLLGCHQGLSGDQIGYVRERVEAFLGRGR